MQKKYDINYSMAVETPHQKWAQPFAGGKIKTFFVPNISHGREVIELAQRFDLDYETITIDRNWDTNKWGLGDYYDLRGAIWDFRVLFENLRNALCSDEHYDVLVIPGINGWGFFPEEIKNNILKRVENGAGLIIPRPVNGIDLPKDEALAKLSPLDCQFEEGFTPDGYAKLDFDLLAHDEWIPADHYITRGVPFELFDFAKLGYYPYTAAPGAEVIVKSASGAPIAAVKTYGKGRVLSLAYIPNFIIPAPGVREFPVEGGCFGSVTLANSYPDKNVRYDEHEYFYAMLGRAVIWAAGKESKAQIKSVSINGDAVSVDANASELSYMIKNEFNEEVACGKIEGGAFALPESLKLGGKHIVTVSALESGAVADFFTALASYPRVSKIVSAGIENEGVLKAGDVLKAKVALEGQRGEVCVGVYDDFNNLLWHTHAKVSDGAVEVEYPVAPQRALNLRVLASLTVDGVLVDRMESPRIIVSPHFRGVDDFEAFLSPTYRGRPDFLLFTGELFRQIGVTGLYPGDSRMVMPAGVEGLGVYWYKRAKYVERKEKYFATKDKQYLHRQPCLNDPHFWEENGARVKKTVSAGKKYGPISYFANDEGSLTCYTDELELCFCPHCMGGLRAWLTEQHGSLEALNRSWGTSFASWDDVQPDTFEEAVARNNFASWGDHRLFMEKTFAGAYKTIIELVRNEDPQAVIRMSGCQTSTPYSGCDYYQLHQYIGYFEAYGGGNQMEFHRSFARPGTIIGGWTGYGVKGITARVQIWGRVLHGLTLQSIFWNASNVNPDFTFPQTAQDLSRVFMEIRREGIGKLLLHSATRDSLGIAVHYSMPSVHGSFARNAEQKFIQNRQGWVDLLENCGYQYNFIASQQIEEGGLSGYRLLILPYSIAISDAEAAQIKAFIENGGYVIGDFQTGIMDQHCGLREKGCLDDVFGIIRHSSLMRPFYTDQEFALNKEFAAFDVPEHFEGFDMAEFGTRALAKASAAYLQDFSSAVPALVVNGHAVYFNFSLDKYPDMNKSGGGESVRQVFKQVMDYAGIVKFASLTDAEGNPLEAGLETVYYSQGAAKYVAVLRQYHSGRKVGHDGLAVGGAGAEAANANALVFHLPYQAHVYDVREKKYLGYTDEVASSIEEGDVRLLSILPEKVGAVRVSAALGDELVVDISVDQGGAAYDSVVAVNFTSPTGKYGFLYSRNVVAQGGAAHLNYKLPLNEEKGEWKIDVKDVASGTTGSAAFTVK